MAVECFLDAIGVKIRLCTQKLPSSRIAERVARLDLSLRIHPGP